MMREPVERHCPNCGVRVSWRAKTCFMCGIRLDENARRRPRLAWSEVVLAIGVLVVVWLWWTRGYRPEAAFPSAPASPTSVVLASPLPTPTHSPTPTATPTPSPTPTPVIHVVKAGESLEYIAGNYGIRMADIVAANQLEDPNRLIVGQRLLIPPPTPDPRRLTPTPTPAGGVANYVVQRGDTLSAIAVRFHTSVAAIQEANGLGDSELIRPGDVLLVPLPTPPRRSVTPTPTPTSAYRWIAPILLAPANETLIANTGAPVLRWAAVGLLGDDEWYVVRVWPEDERLPRPPAYWTRGTSWRVGSEWRPPEAAFDRRYFWQVVVVEAEGEGNERRVIKRTSPPSAIRSFVWGLPVSDLGL